MDRIKIYQVKNISELIKDDVFDSKFSLGYKELPKETFDKHYECSGIFNLNQFKKDNEETLEILENIFMEMNINRNLYDINYSLSINDVIQINDKKYQVMSMGYNRLNY